jgi:hypothetical protein
MYTYECKKAALKSASSSRECPNPQVTRPTSPTLVPPAHAPSGGDHLAPQGSSNDAYLYNDGTYDNHFQENT